MRVLAINPWIYDFAAFDFWLKPYGFLVLLEYLKSKGIGVDFLDCLDKKISNDTFGRGRYSSQVIPKPGVISGVPRYFKRYGKSFPEIETFINGKSPDYILITSSMTYWYPGIIDLIGVLKRYFPSVPVLLGGTYATLCSEHAQKTIKPKHVFKSRDLEAFFTMLKIPYDAKDFFATFPKYEDFYKCIDYVVLRTTWGCPFRCSYCAIDKLHGEFRTVGAQRICSFISKYRRRGIKDFVFYDDALLYKKDYIKEILHTIAKRRMRIRFHTPNALHMRFLDKEIAHLLKQTGFTNPHFGLETLQPSLQKAWGDKVTTQEVISGIKLLKEAGFKPGEFSVYLLLGYPQQDLDRLKTHIEFLHSLGAKVSLAEFSITPQTEIFCKCKADLSEPLLHNNSIFFADPSHTLKEFYAVKNYVRRLNKDFSP